MPRKKLTPEEVPEAATQEEAGSSPPTVEIPAEDIGEDFPSPPGDVGAPPGPEDESILKLSVPLPEPPAAEETPLALEEAPSEVLEAAGEEALPASAAVTAETAPEAPAREARSARQQFFDLDFNALDRDLTAEERQEWNSIYASYRGRSALSGTIIGVDPFSVDTWNRQTGERERETMYCATVVLRLIRIVIPASEMWEQDQARPDFVLRNMVGAKIDFIVTQVERRDGYAMASRRLASRAQRYFFTHRPALNRVGTRQKCRVLSVGPRRCLVEFYGYDINLTQRDLRYTAIPDLRNDYHPGKELDCVITGYDEETGQPRISVKETQPNPFLGAEIRHPVGSRRQAVIAGKYGGGVFCNLPDGTVCMCGYSYQHDDSEFLIGDTVILAVQRYDREKQQMYGKILSKW